MKTKLKSLTLPIAAAATLMFATQGATAQDEAAMLEAFKEFIAPGPQHKQLKSLVGEWETLQKLWMAPGAPVVENKGTAKFRMIMGGRYLVQHYSSAIEGLGKFNGRGTTAYDKVAGEYVQTWLDSFNTGIMVSKGKATDDGKSIELVGEALDPATKTKVKFRTLSKYIDDNNYEMEMYEQ
ncbi:MAG: DUF1579 domain-containing protein, partial [Verrucomicrobiales bacterium]